MIRVDHKEFSVFGSSVTSVVAQFSCQLNVTASVSLLSSDNTTTDRQKVLSVCRRFILASTSIY
jgi:hypothetical protein